MRYRVELKQTVIEATVITVEAKDEDEAERIALEQEEKDPHIIWDFDSVLYPAEIVEISEHPADTVLEE
jgi:hypothetical protein